MGDTGPIGYTDTGYSDYPATVTVVGLLNKDQLNKTIEQV